MGQQQTRPRVWIRARRLGFVRDEPAMARAEKVLLRNTGVDVDGDAKPAPLKAKRSPQS